MEDWTPDLAFEDFPAELRALLVDDLDGIRASLERVRGMWAELFDRAKALPEAALHESVDGEWSFLRTVRHVIYATDTWIGRMAFAEVDAFHPWGQPFDELGDATPAAIELTAEPTLDELIPVFDARLQRVADLLAGLDQAGLDRVCTPPDDTTHPDEPHELKSCVWTVIEEAWWHHGFATRDLDVLTGGG